METPLERECICQYLLSLVKEDGRSMEELAMQVGKPVEMLQKIFDGKESPLLDDLIQIGNALGTKITVQPSVSFAHKKIVRKMNSF